MKKKFSQKKLQQKNGLTASVIINSLTWAVTARSKGWVGSAQSVLTLMSYYVYNIYKPGSYFLAKCLEKKCVKVVPNS